MEKQIICFCPLLKQIAFTGKRFIHPKSFNVTRLSALSFRRQFHISRNCVQNYSSSVSSPTTGLNANVLSTDTGRRQHIPHVGVVFDIDGVLVRGRKVIPCAKEAIRKLELRDIPIIYLTNGGCETEEKKAQYLQRQIGVQIDPGQVVLSHSPLRILDILHHKHVVVSGQGPVSEIAEMCGFSKVSHIDDIDCHFPELDVNDRRKRDRMPISPKKPFYPIEAVLLMGEPVNWEKSLQIILDVLLTSGIPNQRHPHFTGIHIPVVAVNTDYLWMSEAANPRLGHGGFLLCLESVFLKLTGKRLEYTAILGKPNLFTYRYTEGVMYNLVRKKFGVVGRTQTIYGIGDNIDTDIYGANLYNNYLKAVQGSDISTDAIHPHSHVRPDRMKSILVKTGVFGFEEGVWEEVNHLHRDTICRAELAVPTYICDDVLHAVDTILEEEKLA
ncbi:haloacid dehalogenase-like hydrolase domain-containing 5 [Hydractinia symbiolongicarpus]|uniref:haloacid dehalogenase-like hydrolase domain-containing 5 n=1 Tax=Hydractinia symbiolongicarpus TaxID=13093 RepID=UPI00254A5DDD|nr:haloacid dehalogenase-like hydrolase domain-containing 5 [Hydractinia symbiolongicarpus]